MYCTQCGAKIEDGFKFCPECGAAVASAALHEECVRETPKSTGGPYNYCPDGARQQNLSKDEIDKIADEIFWNAPAALQGDAKKLSKDTGIPIREARQMIVNRYNEWKKGKKTGKYPNTQYCPYCASQNVAAIHKPGMILSRQSSAFKSMVISSQTDGVDMMQCQRCGCKWVPKKR